MLTIALEPEAAALYIKHIPIEKRVDESKEGVLQVFCPGTKYIIVDAGGKLFVNIHFYLKRNRPFHTIRQ